MPIHDWTRVDAGIYHHFHHEWISAIHRALLPRLPESYYCMTEQYAGGFGPDILALSAAHPDASEDHEEAGGVALAKVKTRIMEESPDDDFYLLKQKSLVVRHASGDRVVAVVELVSPANKRSRRNAADFVEKAQTLLARRVHMLVVDPFPATNQFPHGVHAAIASDRIDEPFRLSPQAPLCCVAYRSAGKLRAFLEPLAVGDPLPTMPVFLDGDLCLEAPLEETYGSAWDATPKRWRDVVAGA